MTKILFKRRRSVNLLGILFESKVAVMLILANVFVFYLLRSSFITKIYLQSYILYPGNLLTGNFWCIISSGFIHRNAAHLLLNMLGVFIFARIVERHLGAAKTFFIYFGALVLSMLFSTAVYALLLHKNVAIIGASGAVMGLLGAAVLLDPFAITYEMIIPLPVMIKGWMFLAADIKGFLGGERDGVSHLAHLFGFLSVVLLVYFLSPRDKRKMHAGLMINILSFIIFLLLRNRLVNFML